MATENDKNNAAGHDQTSFAGTNPDKYGEPNADKVLDNPEGAEEAQNVSYDGERLSGSEAEKAVNKANSGKE